MPRNEVIERMAKKLYQQDIADGITPDANNCHAWEDLRETYQKRALELLGIVKDYVGDTEQIAPNKGERNPPYEALFSAVLADAFQLAREARERREKGSNDNPDPGSEPDS